MKVLMAGIIALSGLFGINPGQTPVSAQHQLREYVEQENIDLAKLDNKELEQILKDLRIELPTATINSITKTDTTMTVNYDLLDPSLLLMNTAEYNPQIRAYEDGNLVVSEPATVGANQSVTLTGLTANTVYTVIVSGPYDLLGVGEPYNEEPYLLAEQLEQTNKQVPEATIHTELEVNPTIVGATTINVTYDLRDLDGAIINNETIQPRILLYQGDTLVNLEYATIGDNQVQAFGGLTPLTTYRVEITAQYDIDGDGVADNEIPYLLDSEEFTTVQSETRPDAKWDQVYGGIGSDPLRAVEITSDGGYVAVGGTGSSNNGEVTDINNGTGDGLLVKFDSEGVHEWDQVYGGLEYDYFEDIKQTEDGGYIVVGATESSLDGELTDINNGLTDALIIKFDSEGNPEWDQVYGGVGDDVFHAIEITADGGYIVAGETASSASGEITDTNNGDVDGLLVKFDSEGNPEWDQVYGGDWSDIFYNIELTNDGGYIVAGATESTTSGEITDEADGSANALLVKFDNEGNHVWNQVYTGGTTFDTFEDVKQTSDGGYIAVGETNSSASGEITDTSNGFTDGLLVKFDSEGNHEWDKLYGGELTEYFTSIEITPDGGYVVVGHTVSDTSGELTDGNNGAYDGLLVKFDSLGNPEWDQVYGGTENDYFRDVEITEDGDYIVVGYTYLGPSGEITDTSHGSTDGLLVKF